MRRPPALPLLCCLALMSAACTVERTPQSFYDQRKPAATEQEQALSEIRARVRAFAATLGRGNPAGAADALAPTAEARVMDLDGVEMPPRVGPEAVRQAIAEIDAPAPLLARTPDLTVQASVRGNLAWFSTHLEMLPEGPRGSFERLRVSGAFVREAGEWRLVQLHLSRATVPNPAAAAPDSARPAAE